MDSKKKAVIFVILGQSNAVGHALKMTEDDKVTTPMSHVWGLHRDQNQKLDLQKLTWSGYLTEGMNLGETQDHTYSIANCLAKNWQAHIDAGNEKNLPDLYIINISIGAEGVTGNYMWNPNRAPVLIPGKLGTVNISLYPFSRQVFSLVDESFKAQNIEYSYLGLHWRGGENDIIPMMEDPSIDLEGIYKTLIDSFNETLQNPPIVMHKIVAKDRMNDTDPTGVKLQVMENMNLLFQNLGNTYKNITTFDARNFPGYNPEIHSEGLFEEDMIHYTADVNKWVAEQIFYAYLSQE